MTGYKYIKDEVVSFLNDFGFKKYKTSTLYRITGSHLLQFLSFQKGAGHLSDRMTINIVQKGLFVPGCSFDTIQPGNRIGAFMDTEKDKWWQCDNIENATTAISEIKVALMIYVLPFFDHFTNTQHFAELVNHKKFEFVWWIPSTFVDKGYFYLNAGLHQDAINWWENHQPSKVPKFKTIKRLTEEGAYYEVDKILEENCKIARIKLNVNK